jgi:hydroxymethylpyrimidine pyrophosphatase-like HAD family hydrolase
VIVNPLADFAHLSVLLTEQFDAPLTPETADERTLNVFLLVGGLHQILEDYLHQQAPLLDRAAKRLRSYDHPVASRGAFAAETIAAVRSAVRIRRPRVRSLISRAQDLTEVLEAAATAVVAGDDALERAERLWRQLHPAVDVFPRRLLESTVRLPNPFTKFGQRPQDCADLVRKFAERWPDRELQVLVIGVRTSGTYLAPLCRATLIERGYRRVQMLTVRQGQRWRRDEVTRLSDCVNDRGIVLVTDDPPRSGAAFARVAQDCIDHGVPPGRVVLAVQLSGDEESLPEVLRRYTTVLLPRDEWTTERRLSPAAVQRSLEDMLVGREIVTPQRTRLHVAAVGDVDRISSDRSSARARTRAVYRVRLVGKDGRQTEQDVYVCGVGLGYFGDYHRAVAERLRRHLPQVYGVADGLLFREWLPSRSRIAGVAPPRLEERIASYVLERREALSVDRELAARTTDQYSSWDLVADILGWALLGQLRILVAPLTWAAARRLTAVGRPALVDGSMSVSNWFAVPASSPANGAVKVEPDTHTFESAARVTFDPLFDLASAGASFDAEELLSGDGPHDRAFSERLVDAYESLSGEAVERERWFLYQALQNRRELDGLLRLGDVLVDQDQNARRLLATERALAAAEQRYIGDVFLRDLAPPRDGPLCALDIDWVLETRWLDFPVVTPNGALALRALTRHGFRPVLATGRALPELRMRVRAYRLAGGVAEYGAVVYDDAGGRSLSQLSPEEEAELERLRKALRRTPGVYVDDAHRHSVRAIRLVDGRRRGLADETIGAALNAAGVEESVRVVYGHLQTDFAPTSVDKGIGLRALAQALAADATEPFAFAIGDDLPDVPMLELAARRFAPANASPSLREALATVPDTQIVRRPRADGLLEAVQVFLGHDPRRCRICAPPRLSPRTPLLTIPLAAVDANRLGRLRHIAALAASLRRN